MRLSTSLLIAALGSFMLVACGDAGFSTRSSRTLGLGGSDDAQQEGTSDLGGVGDGGEEEKGPDELPPEENEKLEAQCGKKSDFENVIHLNGNREKQSISLAGNTLIIMNGNMPEMNVEGLDQDIERVCVYMRGNQGKLVMAANKTIAKLLVLQRGNLNKAEVHIEGKVTALGWDAAGNQNNLIVDGSGSFTCPVDEGRGNANVLDCQMP